MLLTYSIYICILILLCNYNNICYNIALQLKVISTVTFFCLNKVQGRAGNKSMFPESIYLQKFKETIDSKRFKSKICNIRQKPFFAMKLKKKTFVLALNDRKIIYTI